MTQEEYSAENAQINAQFKKRELFIQQSLRARKEQLEDLTKNYQEERAKIEKTMRELRVQMAEATAEAASRKADLNNRYLEALRADDQD